MAPTQTKPNIGSSAPMAVGKQTSYSAWGMRGIGGMGGITPEQNVIGTMIHDRGFVGRKDSEFGLAWYRSGHLDNNGNKNQQMVQKAVRKVFNSGRSDFGLT